MPDFNFDPLQREVSDEFRHFARDILRPYSLEADRIADLPAGVLSRPEVLNFMRVFVKRELGGGWRGLADPDRVFDIAPSALLRVILCEEAGYGDAALTIALPGAGLAEPVLSAMGSLEQQQRYLGIFLGNSPKWGAFALTEPSCGSDAAALTTRCIKSEGGYVLRGRKWFVGNGARADWVIVFASINPSAGQFGIRSFIVDSNSPGFRVGRVFSTLGLRAVQVSELILEECHVPAKNLLGAEKPSIKNSGYQGVLLTLNLMRPAVSAMAVSIGRAAIDHAQEMIVQNGTNNGHARAWQKLRDSVSSMKTKLHAARLLCLKAAWLYDQKLENAREASMAKALSAQVGMAACNLALDAAASAGVSDLRLLDKLFRDVKGFDILEGTGEMQRLMVARSLLYKAGERQGMTA
jgi:acyl-CoA dehydrogenase